MAANNQNPTQAQLDNLDVAPTVPSHKLDADQYAADDLDGVTESIFGSGNMAYASLQASQTDAFLDTQQQKIGDEVTESNTDRPVVENNSADIGHTNDGNFASSTVGSLSASQLSSDAGAFSPAGSGLSFGDALGDTSITSNITQGSPAASSVSNAGNSVNNVNGVNSVNSVEGENTGTTNNTTINNENITNIDQGDTLQHIDNTLVDLGDTITTLTTTITEVTDVLGDVITNLTGDLLDLTEVTNLVTNVTENLTETVENTLTDITEITENVTNIVNNLLGDTLGGLNLTLDLNILDTLKTGLDIPLGDPLAADIDLAVDLAPVNSFVNTVADLSGLDILSDNLAELNGVTESLQSTIDQATSLVSDLDLQDIGAAVDQLSDTLDNLDNTVADITESVDDAVGGILDNLGVGEGAEESPVEVIEDVVADIVDPADTVENVTEALGDITDGLLGGNGDDSEHDTDITTNLDEILGENEITDAVDEINLDPIEDIVGDLDINIGAGLFGDDETDNHEGDSDITVDIGIDIVENTIVDEALDVPLDPVEDVLGDIDVDIDTAINLLNGNSTDNDEASGNDDTGWTESTITDGGGLFDDIANNTDGLGDALPDPAGTVAEGIGVLDVEPELDIGSIGGLFG